MNQNQSGLPFQQLRVYQYARIFARTVCTAPIQDKELRDQATRAAKSTFLNLAEGLPSFSQPMRRKYFNTSRNSLCEALAAMDLACNIDKLPSSIYQKAQQEAQPIHIILSSMIRN